MIVSLSEAFEYRGGYGYPSPFQEPMKALAGIFTIDVIGVLWDRAHAETTEHHSQLIHRLGPAFVTIHT